MAETGSLTFRNCDSKGAILGNHMSEHVCVTHGLLLATLTSW